jgi:signal transduction histidine kinase
MARLGAQLLSLTRRAADHDDHWSCVDQVVRGMVPLISRLARGYPLELDLDDGGARVPLSSLDVERVLVNLVVNASHAMADRGRLMISTELRVETDSKTVEPGTYVVLVVEDDGEGIPAEVLPRIFEPLFTTKAESGTGLGLPAVLALVEPTGGGVTANSTVGEGTRITVLLPARAAVGNQA